MKVMVCFQYNFFCIYHARQVFMLNLECDFDPIRSCYHLYVLIGKRFREDTCYDMLCCKIFRIMSITLFNSIWLEILYFYKNNGLIKPVQLRPKHKTIMICNKYAKLSRLILLFGLLFGLVLNV